MENTELLEPVQETTPAPEKVKKPKKKRKWLKRLIVIVVIVAILALVLSRCALGQNVVVSGTYLPAQAERQDLSVSVSGTGTIKPASAYKVTTLVRGEVIEAPFEEGDTIKKGDVLFRIDSTDVETAVRQQEISLQNAQLSYENLLKNQQVRAGKSGVVVKLYVESGDNVTMGAPIADILDRSVMKLTVPFHTADCAGFYIGQNAQVTVGGTMETLNGVIDTIAASDSVGAGGVLVRDVTIRVANPGALTDSSTGTASVNGVACSANGIFSYGASQQVVAKASGEIASLHVKEGDRVSENQLLASFDSEGVESARLAVESAKLSLESAKNNLSDYTITSPIDGTVIEKNVDVGDNIDGTTAASGMTVSYPAVVYDLSSLVFDMNINELDINNIQVGQKVEITADALDGKTFSGHVDKININGTTTNGQTNYPVTVVVDEAGDLLPGMNVSAKILVGEEKNAICVPVEAVARGNTVLVAGAGCLDENGNVVDLSKIETRQVTLGKNNDTYIEILDGLSEGETVLIENQSSSWMTALG